MRIRSLYLSIYLTVVAVLLVFALVAGLLVRSHVGGERERIQSVLNERTLALGQLLANSLPEAAAPVDEQASAVQDWSRRMRVPMALDDARGERIAASATFQRIWRDPSDPRGSVVRVPLGDGRVLWLGRPGRRPEGRFGPPPGEPSPGPGSSGEPRPPPPERSAFDRAYRWLDEAGAVLGLMAVLFVAIAAGSYPVVRRLTRRLEALERGVHAFGAGELSHRVAVDGRDEVAALGASFNHAAQRIEDLIRANRSLLANASHELRSPLARLKLALELMETADPARRESLRAEIRRDIVELDELVEEVLLASRLDAQNELRREPVDLLGLLAEEAARVGAQVDGQPLICQGDERLLRRAVRNLLENARRYGGPEIEAVLQRAPTGAAEVRVCDRGPGVPEALRDRVFEPFYRLPGHAERAGGVGLGLSLVRQIARRHGGAARCEGRDGGGSCFVIALPVDDA